jgi:hypothetical protein
MPIEIRELIIRTEISTAGKASQSEMNEKDLSVMKEKLLDECKKIIAANMKKDRYKR